MTRYPTLPEVIRMDAQDMFNHVVRHLMSQGRRCTRGGSRECLYRNASGDACAVGALIPDALYSPDCEHKNANAFLMWAFAQGGMHGYLARTLAPYAPLLCALQRVHDEIHPSNWVRSLTRVAEGFDLNADVLREFPPERDLFRYDDDEPCAVVTVLTATPRMTDAEAFTRMMNALQKSPPFYAFDRADEPPPVRESYRYEFA